MDPEGDNIVANQEPHDVKPAFIDYEPSFLEPLLVLWREAFEFGVGVADPHSLAEQRAYFLSTVLPGHRVVLALVQAELVGFIAFSSESIVQLHVRVGLHRRGVGSALLAIAQAQSGGSLWLYAFVRNVRACRFYEKHGFVPVEHGFEPTWQLADVKYRWGAPAGGNV